MHLGNRYLTPLADWYVAKSKYGRLFRQFYEDFQGVINYSPEELRAWRDERLARAMFCAHTASYYRSEGFGGFITKDIYRAGRSSFLAKGRGCGCVRPWRRTVRTSGTTGVGLIVDTDSKHISALAASWWVFRSQFGVQLGDRGLVFGGRRFGGGDRIGGAPYLDLKHTNQILASAYHISYDTLPGYVDLIRRSGASWVHGYPSSLLQIAAYVVQNGISLDLGFKLISTGSESVSPGQRRLLQEAFNAPVSEFYGQVEGVCSLWRCDHGRLHDQGILGEIELLPAEGEAYAEIVGSAYWNLTAPLIRYRTSDLVTVNKGFCPCGRQNPLGDELDGRTDDYVLTRDGRKVGRLARFFSLIHGVSCAQLVQTGVGVFELRVLRGETVRTYGDLEVELAHILDEEASVIVVEVDALERTQSGKARAVLRRILHS